MTLYRTYRPHRFADLLGQSNASTLLQQALCQERYAHAYLFSGPRGTGKTTSARIFARALACTSPEIDRKSGRFEPCGSCLACTTILANQTPDITEIDAASNRGIDDIRSLREQVHYPPLTLSRKVYIIDEVHMLSGDAFNAFLKTLEEPPPHVTFILATTELHKVPLTVRSRCQLVRYERGSVEAIRSKLDGIVTKEKWTVEEGVTALIAQRADGGFRDAETLIEQLVTVSQPLTLAATRLALGASSPEQVAALLSSCFTADAPSPIETIADLTTTGVTASQLTIDSITLIRQLRTQTSAPADLPPTPLANLPDSLFTFALEQLLEAYILAKSSPIPTLPLELALLRIRERCLGTRTPTTTAASSPPIAKDSGSQQSPPVGKSERLPSPKVVKIAAAPADTSSVVAKAQPAEAAPSVPVVELRDAPYRDIRRAWRAAADRLTRENLAVGQLLHEAIIHTVEGTQLTVHVRFRFHATKLNEKKNRQRVHELLEELTGQAWEVTYEVNADLPKRTRTAQLPSGTPEYIDGHSIVSDAAAIFGVSQSPTSG